MNWKSEAIDRLNRYTAMTAATENIPKEMLRLEQILQRIGSPNPERVSKAPGPGDDRMINNLMKRQELENTYEDARIWVDTTKCALSSLLPDEQKILERMYITPQKGVVAQLCSELGLEQSSIYRKRDHALYRFTLALYGAAN